MTTHPPTQEQIRDSWNAIASGFDEFLTPGNIQQGEDALHRVDIRPGARFLDVAAGSGALSIPAARLGADVVAVDVAPRMIERLAGRARREGLANLQGRVMDGEALQFADDTFDVSASQHGVSLFPDCAGGLAEMARVTKPGGKVLVVAFGSLPRAEFLGFFLAAITAAVPGFPGLPDPPPLPFQLADPEVFSGTLSDAGLSDVAVETTTWHTPFRSGAHLWQVVTSSNPVGAHLGAGLNAEQQADVVRVLDGMLRERSGGRQEAVLDVEVNIGTGTT